MKHMKQSFNPEISEAHKRAQWEEQDTVESHHPVAPPVTKRGALAAAPGKELKRQTAKGGGVRNVFRPGDGFGWEILGGQGHPTCAQVNGRPR